MPCARPHGVRLARVGANVHQNIMRVWHGVCRSKVFRNSRSSGNERKVSAANTLKILLDAFCVHSIVEECLYRVVSKIQPKRCPPGSTVPRKIAWPRKVFLGYEKTKG